MYGTTYLNMQHFGEGHFFVFRVFARFQRSCPLQASPHIFWIGSLSQTLHLAQLTKDITKYKLPPPIFSSQFLRKLSCYLVYIKYIFLHLDLVVYLFKDILTFPCGVLGQVWFLVVSIPHLCLLTCFFSHTRSGFPLFTHLR